MRKLLIAGLLAVLVPAAAPWAAAGSNFLARADTPPGSADYITTTSGNSGLLVTEDGVTLEGITTGTGLNRGGVYWFGSPEAPTDVFAFTFTHHAEGSPVLTVRFDGTDFGDESEKVEFSVYDSRDRFIGLVSGHERELSFQGGPAGSTYYVVVKIDTHDVMVENDVHGVFSVTIR